MACSCEEPVNRSEQPRTCHQGALCPRFESRRHHQNMACTSQKSMAPSAIKAQQAFGLRPFLRPFPVLGVFHCLEAHEDTPINACWSANRSHLWPLSMEAIARFLKQFRHFVRSSAQVVVVRHRRVGTWNDRGHRLVSQGLRRVLGLGKRGNQPVYGYKDRELPMCRGYQRTSACSRIRIRQSSRLGASPKTNPNAVSYDGRTTAIAGWPGSNAGLTAKPPGGLGT